MPAAAVEGFRSAEHAGPANRLRTSEASAIEPVERNRPGAEPAARSAEARAGHDQAARSPARAAPQRNRAAPRLAGHLPAQGGRPVAGVPERPRHAAAAAEPL